MTGPSGAVVVDPAGHARSASRPSAAGSTPVGTLGSPHLALVDGGGRVAPLGVSWALDWWIGAEDRWHVPGDERAVRQHLVDGAPVVETAMRIPGGDAVQRAWAVPGPAGPTVVVEVENTSPVPVALALVVVPSGSSPGSPAEVQLDEDRVLVEGEVALVLAKAPNRVAASGAGTTALQAIVTAGEAGERLEGPVSADAGGAASLAVVVPLPHRASLRVRLPLAGGDVVAEPLPDGDAVARGWTAQADRGARIELPDDRWNEALAASRRSSLLWAQASGDLRLPVAAHLATGLARLGIGDEALAVLAELTERPGAARALRRRSRDVEARRSWVEAVERVRDVVGDDVLAEALGGAPRGTAFTGPRPGAEAAEVQAWLDAASPTWGWADREGAPADPARTADLLALVVDALVHETEDGLALLPSLPASWLGQGVEVHDLPTPRGHLSFAVRWHGERPALLWDLQPVPGGPDPEARLTVPGLDPAWATDDLRGDALLGAPR